MSEKFTLDKLENLLKTKKSKKDENCKNPSIHNDEDWFITFDRPIGNDINNYYFNTFQIMYMRDIEYCPFLKNINKFVSENYTNLDDDYWPNVRPSSFARSKLRYNVPNSIYNYITLNDEGNLVLTYVIIFEKCKYLFTINAVSEGFDETLKNEYTNVLEDVGDTFDEDPIFVVDKIDNSVILEELKSMEFDTLYFLNNLYNEGIKILDNLCLVQLSLPPIVV